MDHHIPNIPAAPSGRIDGSQQHNRISHHRCQIKAELVHGQIKWQAFEGFFFLSVKMDIFVNLVVSMIWQWNKN